MSLGSLAFSRDVFLNLPLIALWQAIAPRREQLINDNFHSANLKRHQYDYAAGQNILKRGTNQLSWE